MKRRAFLSLATALPLLPAVNLVARGRPAEPTEAPPAIYGVESTFENFVPAAADAISTCHALQTLADRAAMGRWGLPPILLLGEPGMGKTHLLRAFHHRLDELAPEKYFKLTRADLYTSVLIRNIRRGELPRFRRNHSDLCEGLLFDDIAPIGKGEIIQEEFLSNLKALEAANKPVLMTSSRHPDNIKGLNWELRQYLKGCIQLTVSRPSYNEKRKIAQTHAQAIGLQLTTAEYHEICETTHSVRELVGRVYQAKLRGEGLG